METSTGLKAPNRSELSLLSLTLMTCSLFPAILLRCCTAAVLPTPVSPTSRTGWSAETDVARNSSRLQVWRFRQ